MPPSSDPVRRRRRSPDALRAWVELPGGGYYPYPLHERRARLLAHVGQWQLAESEMRSCCRFAEAHHLDGMLADARALLGMLLLERSENAEGAALAALALAHHRASGDGRGLKASLRCAARARSRLGEYGEAAAMLEELLDLCRRQGDDEGAIEAESELAGISWARGDFPAAMRGCQAKLELARRTGNLTAAGIALASIGNIYWTKGQPDQALDHYRQALDIARAIGDRFQYSTVLNLAGIALFESGRYRESRQACEEQIAIAEMLGDQRGMASGRGNLGRVLWHTGSPREALECYAEAGRIAERTGDRLTALAAAGNTGWIHMDQGEFGPAREPLERAVAMARGMGAKYYLCLYTLALAQLDLAAGPGPGTPALLDEGAALADELGNAELALKARFLRCRLAETEDPERAAEMFEALLAGLTDDSWRTEILVELYRLTGKSEHRELALELLREKYQATGNVECKREIEELEAK